jgi:hypothetical protein
MSDFKSASENMAAEEAARRQMAGKLLPFGVAYLDDALLGIRPDDLIILGAPSGVGKTQLCTTIAEAVISKGKRVHFFALEADEYEVERRMRFTHLANLYYHDPQARALVKPVVYDQWESDVLTSPTLLRLDAEAKRYCEGAFENLFTYYKQDEFNVTHLVEQFARIASTTDLIIVDHVHYFDWSGQNDNEAMKEIAKTARSLVNQFKVPMILVAHLRKRDRNAYELVPGLDEFHGSSDLAKIATKAITIAGGGPDPQGRGFITFMRTPKNRKNGGVTRSLAKVIFNPRTGQYGDDYDLGPSNQKEFEIYAPGMEPDWFGRTKRRNSGDRGHGVPEEP